MEGLEQSKARMPVFILQLVLSLLAPVAVILLELLIVLHFLAASAVINAVFGSLFSIAAASVGIHMIRRRIHADHFLEILFTLNIIVATLSGIGWTTSILRIFAHISYSSGPAYSRYSWTLSRTDWVVNAAAVIPSAILFGLSVYIALAVSRINKMSEKRRRILISGD